MVRLGKSPRPVRVPDSQAKLPNVIPGGKLDGRIRGATWVRQSVFEVATGPDITRLSRCESKGNVGAFRIRVDNRAGFVERAGRGTPPGVDLR